MNIIKKIQKKQKRKKLMRQKARLAQEQAAQEALTTGELLIAEGFQEREKR